MAREDRDRARYLPFSVIAAGSGNGLCHTLGIYDTLVGCENCVKGMKSSRQTSDHVGISNLIDVVECWQPETERRAYSFLSQSWGVVADVDFEVNYRALLGLS